MAEGQEAWETEARRPAAEPAYNQSVTHAERLERTIQQEDANARIRARAAHGRAALGTGPGATRPTRCTYR